MSITVDVRGTTFGQLERTFRDAFPKQIQQAAVSTLNRVGAKIRTDAVREISKKANIRPAKLIRQRTRIAKANKNRLQVRVYFKTGPMPLEIIAGKNGPKWNRKMSGVTIKDRYIEGAFTGTPRQGKHANKRKRVYVRVSDTRDNRQDLRPQYAVLELHGQILIDVGNRVIKDMFENEFNRQLNYRMLKLKRKV